jgi:hypothetical protein
MVFLMNIFYNKRPKKGLIFPNQPSFLEIINVKYSYIYPQNNPLFIAINGLFGGYLMWQTASILHQNN